MCGKISILYFNFDSKHRTLKPPLYFSVCIARARVLVPPDDALLAGGSRQNNVVDCPNARVSVDNVRVVVVRSTAPGEIGCVHVHVHVHVHATRALVRVALTFFQMDETTLDADESIGACALFVIAFGVSAGHTYVRDHYVFASVAAGAADDVV